MIDVSTKKINPLPPTQSGSKGNVSNFRKCRNSRNSLTLESHSRGINSTSRILVVDDSSACLKVLTRHVQSLGYEFDTCIDGLAAIETLQKSSDFCAALMDLSLPR